VAQLKNSKFNSLLINHRHQPSPAARSTSLIVPSNLDINTRKQHKQTPEHTATMPADEPYDPAQSPRSELDSDDDLDRPGPSRRGGPGGRDGGASGRGGKGGAKGGKSKGKGKDAMNAWEGALKRSWDVVQEDESGGLQAAVESLIARGRRKR